MSDSSAHQVALSAQKCPKTQVTYINRGSLSLAKTWTSDICGALCVPGSLLGLFSYQRNKHGGPTEVPSIATWIFFLSWAMVQN